MDKKVYISILNYNGWEDTIECLESVLRNDYPNYQVIVIDNNSPNKSMEYIKMWAEGKLDVWVNPEHPLRHLSYPPVNKPIPYVYYNREEAEAGGDIELEESLSDKIPDGIATKYPLVLIQTGENLGFAGGNNVGIRYLFRKQHDTENSLVWLLNPDMVMEDGSIRKMVECVKLSSKEKAIYGIIVKDYSQPSNILFIGGAKIIKALGIVRFISSFKDIKYLDYISGGNLITNLSTFKDLGYLPEEYFLYWEDADWCTKAKAKGYKLLVCNNISIYDKKGTSIGRNTEVGIYFYEKNALLYTKKYNKIFYFVVFFGLFPRTLKNVIRKRSILYVKVLTKILFETIHEGGTKLKRYISIFS